MSNPNVAVLIPCFNEEKTIGSVVRKFRSNLPNATIYVYDNNSTDKTAQLAAESGAKVFRETRQGKGFVVRRMFADVEADIYVLVDGDDTYDVDSINVMIGEQQSHNLDMVVGVRDAKSDGAYRRGHEFGNSLFSSVVQLLFGRQFNDILSGYRVLSRRFVKTFPAFAKGFEIETQLTIHALELALPCSEIATPYFERPEGSHSKLSTFRDGAKIAMTIILLLKESKPFLFFGLLAGFSALCSLVLGIPLVWEYVETGLVPRVPTAILATGVAVLASTFLTAGLILDSVSRMRRESIRMEYLKIPFNRFFDK